MAREGLQGHSGVAARCPGQARVRIPAGPAVSCPSARPTPPVRPTARLRPARDAGGGLAHPREREPRREKTRGESRVAKSAKNAVAPRPAAPYHVLFPLFTPLLPAQEIPHGIVLMIVQQIRAVHVVPCACSACHAMYATLNADASRSMHGLHRILGIERSQPFGWPPC